MTLRHWASVTYPRRPRLRFGGLKACDAGDGIARPLRRQVQSHCQPDPHHLPRFLPDPCVEPMCRHHGHPFPIGSKSRRDSRPTRSDSFGDLGARKLSWRGEKHFRCGHQWPGESTVAVRWGHYGNAGAGTPELYLNSPPDLSHHQGPTEDALPEVLSCVSRTMQEPHL